MTTPDLLATCWTTAGDAVPLPGRDASPIPLPERIAAAARAGFAGFGLMHVDLAAYLRDSDLTTLAQLIADHGITTVELEFLTSWWEMGGPDRQASDQVLDLLLRASEVLAPHHVKIGPDITGGAYNADQWAEQFHRVSSAFAQVGTPVALEFMPFSNVDSLDRAVDLVRRADHPNGGLMLDLWHIERGRIDFRAIAGLPAGVVKGVEIDDGDAEQVGDGYSDTVLRRRLCGHGAFRIPEFITIVQDLGWDGPWGVEILSDEYRVWPLARSVPEAYLTANECFAAAAQRRTARSTR